MDPMTMMAIASTAMNLLKGASGGGGSGGGMFGGGGGAQQQPQQQPQMQPPQPKPFMPGPLPSMNTTDYGSVIKNMLNSQQPPMPGMQPQGQGQSF